MQEYYDNLKTMLDNCFFEKTMHRVCVLRFCLSFVSACCALISAKTESKLCAKKMRSFWQTVKKICGLARKIFLLSNKISFSVKKYLVVHSSNSRVVKCEVKQISIMACVNWSHLFSKICYFSQHGSRYESEPLNWSTFDSFAYFIFITCRALSVSHLRLR